MAVQSVKCALLLPHSSFTPYSLLSLTPGSGILITTYAGVRIYRDLLLSRKWDYVVLDEGHKIRNPDAEITLVCKQVHENKNKMCKTNQENGRHLF